jgi:hypothetical protein
MTGLGGRGDKSTGTGDLREVSKSGGQAGQGWLRARAESLPTYSPVRYCTGGGEVRRLRDLTGAGNESETGKPTVSWSLSVIKSDRQTVINARMDVERSLWNGWERLHRARNRDSSRSVCYRDL